MSTLTRFMESLIKAVGTSTINFGGLVTAQTPSSSDNSTNVATTGFVNNVGCPVGSMLMWPTTTPPDGWLSLNGRTFSLTEYPELAKIFPSGILPDWSGMYPRGYDPTAKYDIDGKTRDIMTYQEGSSVAGDSSNDVTNINHIGRDKARYGIENPAVDIEVNLTANSGGTFSTKLNANGYGGVARVRNLNCLFIVRAV